MAIRSPKDGYDFEAKQKYREDVWGVFRDQLDNDANILFFPSKEGLEIPIALNLGFKQANLIAVDSSPAVIATSKWRKKYPDIKFYGGMLSQVIARIEEDGLKIDGANLDFCNNLSHELIDEINSFASSKIISHKCVMSITVMNGRESKSTNTIADLFLSQCNGTQSVLFENKRLAVISANLKNVLFSIHGGSHISNIKESSYLSGKIRMSYGLIEICSDEYLGYLIKKDYEDNFKSKAEYVVEKASEFSDFLHKCSVNEYNFHKRKIKKDDFECIVIYSKILSFACKPFTLSGDAFKVDNKILKKFGIPRVSSNHIMHDNAKLISVFNENHLTGHKRQVDSAFCSTGTKRIKNIEKYIESIGCYNFT